jgi:hypothetical protein
LAGLHALALPVWQGLCPGAAHGDRPRQYGGDKEPYAGARPNTSPRSWPGGRGAERPSADAVAGGLMPMGGTETGQTPRIDAVSKVTGQAVYTEDLPLPPGTLYGAILRSPYAHARLVAI